MGNSNLDNTVMLLTEGWCRFLSSTSVLLSMILLELSSKILFRVTNHFLENLVTNDPAESILISIRQRFVTHMTSPYRLYGLFKPLWAHYHCMLMYFLNDQWLCISKSQNQRPGCCLNTCKERKIKKENRFARL